MAKNPYEQSIFDIQPAAKPQGPVECLGMTFDNDKKRRDYFLDKLREKLKDPEFRKIEGFPIGEDEDILALSDPIPNDTVSFSAGFPEDVRQQIVDGLIAYAETEEGLAVLSNDEFYAITGFTPVDDAAFDPIRIMIQELGLTEEEILD